MSPNNAYVLQVTSRCPNQERAALWCCLFSCILTWRGEAFCSFCRQKCTIMKGVQSGFFKIVLLAGSMWASGQQTTVVAPSQKANCMAGITAMHSDVNKGFSYLKSELESIKSKFHTRWYEINEGDGCNCTSRTSTTGNYTSSSH